MGYTTPEIPLEVNAVEHPAAEPCFLPAGWARYLCDEEMFRIGMAAQAKGSIEC